MTTVFADSYYFLAIVSEKDAGHKKALEFSSGFHGQIVTTDLVLVEVGDALSAPPRRQTFLDLIDSLRADESIIVVEGSRELFDEGLRLFAARSDKSWSFTDCTSIVVMDRYRLVVVLTADHHFQQAGLTILL
jgi:uncharacterized protein